MMTPSAVAASVINARLTPDLRGRLRAHSGATIALHIGGLRMCFRLGGDGRWQAASSLIDADAEMRTDGGEFSVSGGGALLRDLDEVRRRCAPRMIAEEIFGADGADFLLRTAETIRERMRDLPARCGVAASPPEVAEFVRKTAVFDSSVNAAAARISRLESQR